jgi:AcrR family transcriptional regulator
LYAAHVPKVSQQYRDARREQILTAAKRCFVRDGFHETSMQDLFAESGLSAGAVYRYFPGKDDMIVSIAEENMCDVVALIHTMTTEPRGKGVGAALASVLEVLRTKHAEEDLGAMAVLVWSEALRNPALADRFDALLATMRVDLAEVIRDNQGRGTMPVDVAPEALAALLMTIIPGFILQLAMFGDTAVAAIPDAARSMWPG